jgi:hypothetical protein
MSEKDRPEIKGLNPSRRGKRSILMGQSVVASVLESKGCKILDGHRFTGDEVL